MRVDVLRGATAPVAERHRRAVDDVDVPADSVPPQLVGELAEQKNQRVPVKGPTRYGQIGGFTVRHDGAPGAILARGLLSDAAVGYSASLEFLDPGTAKSVRYHGAGLRLADVGGTPVAPAVVAYNGGMAVATVTGRMRIATPDGTPMAFEFPQARLEPGEARPMDLFDIWRRARFYSDAPAGIEFDYNVAPGAVVLSATSVSADLRHAIRVPLTDPLSPPSATGGYPWRVTATSGTVVIDRRVGVGNFIPACSQSSNNRNCTTRIGQSWTADGHAVGTYAIAFRRAGVGVTKR